MAPNVQEVDGRVFPPLQPPGLRVHSKCVQVEGRQRNAVEEMEVEGLLRLH